MFRPEPEPLPEQIETIESKHVIESQNGPANAAIPEWVSRFYSGRFHREGIRYVEALDINRDSYVFIGKNRGTNLNALHQWAEEFTVARDLPRLVTIRIEDRLLAAASLYPDDEYGEFFEAVIKSASNVEYPEAVKKGNFWTKWRINGGDKTAPDLLLETTEAENTAGQDIYEFLVLISIDKIVLQTRIQELMANIQTVVSPTREQAVSIRRVQLHFFEGF
jgi:hypothetical protein